MSNSYIPFRGDTRNFQGGGGGGGGGGECEVPFLLGFSKQISHLVFLSTYFTVETSQ